MTSALPPERTLQNWKRALNLARILFEEGGYHSRYLDDLEVFLRRTIATGPFSIPADQLPLWHRLFANSALVAVAELAPFHVEAVTDRSRFVELLKTYPRPLPVDRGGGVVGGSAGLIFLEDDSGRIVAYAPPKRDPAQARNRRDRGRPKKTFRRTERKVAS